MQLFIQVQDGQCINHPAFKDNLIQAFGLIPDNWESFERIPRPDVGVYDVLESEQPVYQKINGVWKDVWSLRSMTQEEKEEKQNNVKAQWASRYQAENWSAWVFNESTCSYDPPVPYPTDTTVPVFWCGSENVWKIRPPMPSDENKYIFDYINWQWVINQ